MAAFNIKVFLIEARRRRVFRVAALYVVGAWVALQAADLAFPGLGIADSAIRYIWFGAIVGLPVALILGWRYDIVGGHIVRTAVSDIAAELSIRRIDYLILGALAVVVAASTTGLVLQISQTRVNDITRLRVADIDPKSIAVLPFVNMSSEEENAYFGYGISEELLNLLVRNPEWKVSSRTSSFYFAGKDVALKVIAANLGVRNILEGSVRRDNNRVRINVQLIDASTDTHLWSGVYDREMINVFAVQNEIAMAIADELQVSLASSGQPAQPTENEAAYDKYLRGLHFLHKGYSPENIIRARDYFVAAIDLDPKYAQAHAQLALALIALGNFRILAPPEVYPDARKAASTALDIDNSLPEAHVALGWAALSYEFDWRTAEDEFRQAIELAPNYYAGHQGLAWPLQATGRSDEALAAARRARELDPLSIWTRATLAEIYYKRRDYDAALEQAKAMLEMQPDDALTTAWIGQIYAQKHMPGEALTYASEAANKAADDPNLELAVALVHAMLGNKAEARKILGLAEARTGSQFVSPGLIANVYANLNEKDLAFFWLARAVDVYDSFVFNLDYPDWDPIRADPRFGALCVRLGLACAE